MVVIMWGNTKDGEYVGQGTLTSPYGEKYLGKWKNGKKHSQGTFTYPDGRKYVGEFKEWGLLNGQGTFTSPDGEEVCRGIQGGEKDMVKEHKLPLMVGTYIGEWKDGKSKWSRNTTLGH